MVKQKNNLMLKQCGENSERIRENVAEIVLKRAWSERKLERSGNQAAG